MSVRVGMNTRPIANADITHKLVHAAPHAHKQSIQHIKKHQYTDVN